MKYLKQYEAFQSNTISKVLNYVKSNIDKKNYNKFIEALQKLMANSNIPIDKLTDDHIQYMNAKKALDIKNMDFSNNENIWAIKYWFSLKDGYMGYTGTGRRLNDIEDSQFFDEEELSYIRENISKTGLLKKVVSLDDIKTGDIILAYFNSNISKDVLALGTVYIDNNGRYFAIQNVSSGTTARSDEWKSYTQFGDKCWQLNSNMNRGDTKRLHLFTPSDKELQYSDDMGDDYSLWNLPIDSSLNLRDWSDIWYIRSDINNKKSLNDADFAVVLYYDSIIKTNFEPVSDIRYKRKEARKDATRLMNDKTIRNQNIERYFKKLADNLNMTEEGEFYDLNRLIKKHLASQYTMITLLRGNLDINSIDEYIGWIYSAIEDSKNGDKPGVKYYINAIKSYYLTKSIEHKELMDSYRGNEDYIKNEELKKTFNEVLKIGTRISDYFSNIKLDDIDDLFVAFSKLKSVSDVINSDRVNLSSQIRRITVNFKSRYDIGVVSSNSNYDELSKDSDISKLKIINKYLDSILI